MPNSSQTVDGAMTATMKILRQNESAFEIHQTTVRRQEWNLHGLSASVTDVLRRVAHYRVMAQSTQRFADALESTLPELEEATLTLEENRNGVDLLILSGEMLSNEKIAEAHEYLELLMRSCDANRDFMERIQEHTAMLAQGSAIFTNSAKALKEVLDKINDLTRRQSSFYRAWLAALDAMALLSA